MKAGESSSERGSDGAREFCTTHWSVVLAAGDTGSPHAAEALERLCASYWYPLYAYVRRAGHGQEDAQDLTQAFFARFLEKRYFRLAQPERGRFRSFLLTSLKHFLVNEWHHAQCSKRGGGAIHVPLDPLTAERLYANETASELPPDKFYERSWVLAVLDQVRTQLREEYAGKQVPFQTLEEFLPGEKGTRTYAQAARQLGVPEGTLKSEVHRCRRRYRQLLRAAIGQTVAHPTEIDEELRHLLAVLGE